MFEPARSFLKFKNRAYAVWELVQVFAGYEDVVVVGSFYGSSEIFRGNKIISFIDEDEGVGYALQVFVPVFSMKCNTAFRTVDCDAAFVTELFILTYGVDKRGLAGGTVTAYYRDISFYVESKGYSTISDFDSV